MTWPRRPPIAHPRPRALVVHAADDDVPAIASISHSGFDLPLPAETFDAWFGRYGHGGFVARCNGVVAGYALYHATHQLVEVADLAVRPDYRRRGVGRELARSILDLLSEDRPLCRAAIPEDRLDRHGLLGAAHFWRAMGFEARLARPARGPQVYHFACEIGGQL